MDRFGKVIIVDEQHRPQLEGGALAKIKQVKLQTSDTVYQVRQDNQPERNRQT